MNHSARRRYLRACFDGTECVSPASVYDAMSARIAELAGFRIGIYSGRIASGTTLACPDLNLITMSEFADQVRRLMRASNLSLIVDADHGYGNALNTMRTVEELEYAGASLISIEDTSLPVRFGQALGQAELISPDEMVGKLRAAVAARQDPGLMIAGRTAALGSEGLDRTVERAQAYAAAGADAIFLMHVTGLEEIATIHAACRLPIVVGLGPPSLRREDMAARGVRVLTQGHHPVAAAAKALQDAYAHFYRGGTPDEIRSKFVSDKDMEKIVRGEMYDAWRRDYLRAPDA